MTGQKARQRAGEVSGHGDLHQHAGRFHLRLIDDPDMVRTIALLQPEEGGRRIPAGLKSQILACAEDLRATLEAVT